MSSFEETSNHFASNGILPSFCSKFQDYVISPNGRGYRTWQILLAVFALYIAWISPIEFGFFEKPQTPFSTIDNVINGFFFIEIILTFFVAYVENDSYLIVNDKRRIALKYISSGLLFDIISTIPSELTMKIPLQSLWTYNLFNMLRLWRVRKVINLFARVEKDKKFNHIWVLSTKFFCVTLFAVHCAGCFYYRLATHYTDPQKTWIRYVASIYWSIGTLTTKESNNLQFELTRDMILNIFYMIFNIGLTTYIVGTIINLVVYSPKKSINLELVEVKNWFEMVVGDVTSDQIYGENRVQLRMDPKKFLNIFDNDRVHYHKTLEHSNEIDDSTAPILSIDSCTAIQSQTQPILDDMDRELRIMLYKEQYKGYYMRRERIKKLLDDKGYHDRVSIFFPEVGGKKTYILLPNSLEKIKESAQKIFGVYPSKILTIDITEIKSIEEITDDDHLLCANYV